ncbi:MAG TPA: hypothetical protein PLU62_05385 [Ignavibacteriales bacterium]|nr:hypothetical protein [Ignavibacteriales bacterium]HPP33370.1 hypothetical protein [Ignavibacteriales bacterium]
MSKQKKNILFNIILISLIVITIIFYVVIKIEIQNIEKEKLDIEQSLKVLNDEQNIMLAKIQKYQSAEIVIPIATQNLQMIKNFNVDEVELVKDEFINLMKVIEKKYE